MPTSKVDLVRGAYEAWNRRDFDAAFSFLDPDIEVSPPPDLPEAGTYRGRARIRRLWEEFEEAWDEIRAEPESFIDAGDRVLATVRYSGRGKGSQAVVRGAVLDAHIWTLREGRAVKLEMYQGTAGALAAVGLKEQA
jgi:ketosteroid isomerase-like protein